VKSAKAKSGSVKITRRYRGTKAKDVVAVRDRLVSVADYIQAIGMKMKKLETMLRGNK
jgi:hypothetical protein